MGMHQKKCIIGFVFLALLFSGCSLPWKSRVAESDTLQGAQAAQVIMKITPTGEKTYDYFIDIRDGLTAFDLFKYAGVPVEAKFYDFGAYVQTVGGVKEGDGLFWIYYLNSTPAMQAADKYQVKKGDIIEWKLEKEKKGL